MNPTLLPAEGTLPLLILQIIAVSGEFPATFSSQFPGGSSYIESVIGKLKKDGLLRSYTKNGLRGLRLTASAKRLLLQKYPFDLTPFLTGASETNFFEVRTRAPAEAAPDGRGAFDPAQRTNPIAAVGKAIHTGLASQIPLYFRSIILHASSNRSAVFAPKSAIPA